MIPQDKVDKVKEIARIDDEYLFAVEFFTFFTTLEYSFLCEQLITLLFLERTHYLSGKLTKVSDGV